MQIEIGNCDLEERCIHIFFYALTRLLSLSLSPSLIFSLSARFFLSSFVGTHDTRLRAHISNTRGDHFQQQPCSLRTRGIYRYREIFPSPNLVVNDSVHHFQQHTLYESFIPRTPVFARIFQTLLVTIFGSFRTSLFVPRTSFFVCVFQTLEVTTIGSSRTSIFIPRTPVFVRIF